MRALPVLSLVVLGPGGTTTREQVVSARASCAVKASPRGLLRTTRHRCKLDELGTAARHGASFGVVISGEMAVRVNFIVVNFLAADVASCFGHRFPRASIMRLADEPGAPTRRLVMHR